MEAIQLRILHFTPDKTLACGIYLIDRFCFLKT